jgi:hypothetical protein
MTPIEHLTQLQHSDVLEGPFALYIYEANSEYHRGPLWFTNKSNRPAEDEIPISVARRKVEEALIEGREIRIVDRGDMLVFHAKSGKVLYPNHPEKFWEEMAA